MLQGFRIYEKGVFIGTVKSTSLLCAQTYDHIAYRSDGVTKFVYKHDKDIHTLAPINQCTAGNSYKIATEHSLFDFLYTPDCSHGVLSNNITIQAFKTSTYTISGEKFLDGSGFSLLGVTGSAESYVSTQYFNADPLQLKYLFRTDSSLTLQDLSITGFSDPSLTIIDSSGSYLGLSGCTFSNNKVYQHIFVENALNRTDICYCVFHDVASKRSDGGGGGAILSLGKTVSIYDSSFIRNYSPNDGGAIKLYNGNGTLTLSGHNHFIDNSSIQLAGAIAVDSSINIYGIAEFSGNSTSLGGGGAIDSFGSCNIYDASVTFRGNRGRDAGGAIAVITNYTSTDSSVTFISNYSKHSGGAISSIKDLKITGGTTLFSGNKAPDGSGGAIYVAQEGIFILDSSGITFSGNEATDGSNIWIPSDVNAQTSFITEDVSFTDSNPGVYPLALEKNRAMVITTASDLSNFMGDASHVGVIRNDISNITPSDISFSQSKTFYGSILNGRNPVLSPSGSSLNTLIYSNSGDLYLYNLDVSGFVNTNLVTTRGTGALVVNSKDNIHIHSCNIHNNSGQSTINSVTGNIIGTGSSSFKNNKSKVGSTLQSAKSISLDGSFSFVDNTNIGGSAGALWAGADLSLLGGPYEFRGNKDALGGGAIKAIYVHISTTSATFQSNSTMGDGNGGGAINSSNTIILDGSFSFVDNSNMKSLGGALKAGGDISLLGGPYEFSGNMVMLPNDWSYGGGAIYSDGTVDINTGTNLVVFNHNRCAEPSGQHIYTYDICYNGSVVEFIDPSCTNGPDGSAVWTMSEDPSTRCPP